MDLAPEAGGVAWVLVFYGFFMGFHPLSDLRQWIHNLSVFEHVPEILVEDFVWPRADTHLDGCGGGGASLAAFRNRDLAAT